MNVHQGGVAGAPKNPDYLLEVDNPMVETIIRDYWDMFMQRHFVQLAKVLGIDLKTLEGIVEAGRRYELPNVVRAYEGIIKDEKFHVGLGRLLLDRYAAGDDDLAEVRR